MKLYDSRTNQELQIGDRVTTFRGEPCTLKDMREPHKPSSTGRVYVKIDGRVDEYFPSVIGAEWR